MAQSFSFKKIEKKYAVLFFYLVFSFFNSSIQAQLSRKHYLPPFHTEATFGMQDHYVYLSTFHTQPFAVIVTDGENNQIEGSPFVISKGNPVAILVAAGVNNSRLFVNDSELNTALSSKGLILEADKLFYAGFRSKLSVGDVDAQTPINAGYLTCKGTSALGTSFRLGSIPHGGPSGSRNFFASFMATENNTTVNITDYNPDVLFDDEIDLIDDDQITVTLNAGESYVVAGNSENGDANIDGFIGALVSSNNPIAVNTGNYSGGFSTASSTDIAIDQIVPVSDIGDEYIAVRGNGTNVLEKLIVVGVTDGTFVFVNGSATPYNATPLNAGEYLIIEGDQYQGTSNQNIYLTSSEPVYLYQSIGGSPDQRTTGFNYLPPLSCFFIKEINEIPNVRNIGDSEYDGNIVVITEAGSTVTVNGAQVIELPENVMGSADWETYRIDDVSGNISVASTGALSVAFYGTSNAAGFSGYYSTFSSSNDDNQEINLCSDEPVNLIEQIDGFVDENGTWSPALSSGTNIFTPNVDVATMYTYTTTNACETTTLNFTIIVNEPPTIADDLQLNSCDEDNNGFAEFDLDAQIDTLVDGQDDISVTFHETQEDADFLLNPIVSPYESDEKTIIIRFENTISSCVSYGTYDLTLGGAFNVSSLTFEKCSDNTSGFFEFDLTEIEEELLNGTTGIVSFHELESEAISSVNPLVSPYNTDSKIIYANVASSSSCFSIVAIDLVIGSGPDVLPDLEYEACDDDSDGFADFDLEAMEVDILGGQTDVTVSFYATENDADLATNALASPYSTNADNLHIRLENDNTGCYSLGEISLNINSAPDVLEDLIYSQCGSDSTGTVDFDLDSQIERIVNGQTDVSVTFYESDTEALAVTNALASPYTTGSVTIFTRLENDITGCFSVGELELNANDGVQTGTGIIYELCDDDSDGMVSFDLDAQIEEIKAGQTNAVVTFHLSPEDAEQGLNPLSSPYDSGDIVLHTRIDDTTTDCFAMGTLELRVNTLPSIATVLPYEACDDNNDGLADFDLDAMVVDILGTQTGVTVSFYATENDADLATNALGSPYATNADSLHIRLENDNTACYSLGEISLIINSAPDILEDLIYSECESNDDGTVDFDLDSQIERIVNGQTDVSVTFYESDTEALAATNALVSPYTTGSTTIFTRLENDITGCFSLGELELNANDGLQSSTGVVYELCDDDSDGIVSFDLDAQIEELKEGQTNAVVTFHLSAEDAEQGLNPLSSPYASADSLLYTRIDDLTTDCFAMGTLELRVNTLPTIATVLPYEACDDNNDGFADFDLQTIEAEVLAGQTNISVSFYLSLSDAENNENSLTSPYESEGAEVYTRLENDISGCASIGTVNLVVNSIPEIELDDIYYLCKEDETSAIVLDATPSTGGDYLYFWIPENNNVDASGNQSAIYDVSVGGEYSVTVVNQNSSELCENTVTTEVIESSSPKIKEILGTSELFITNSASVIEIETVEEGNYEYSLDGVEWQDSPLFRNLIGGSYEALVRDKNGCGIPDSQTFELIVFTKFFTPNADGVNDYWNIEGLSEEYEASIFIFDRFGKFLSQINPLGLGWDGVFAGKNMPSDDYWVLIEYKNNGVLQNFKSHFTLIR